MQFTVGDLLVDGWLVPFPDDGDLVAPGFQVSVDAVGAGVEGSVFKPFNVKI